MAFAKAPYKGDGTGRIIRGCSPSLRSTLKIFHPSHGVNTSSGGLDPADDFADSLIAIALWAQSELDAITFESTKSDSRRRYPVYSRE